MRRLTICALAVLTIAPAVAQDSRWGVVDPAALVERRFGTGQLRLGVPRVNVVTG